MKFKIFLPVVFAIVLILTASVYAAPIKGFVFEDLNGNMKREPGEPGVPGVSVSNGRQVVPTDSLGGYFFQNVPDETALFISKPAGYDLPLNENNLPQFYYVHRPEGSPKNFKYKGMEATGPLPRTLDFPLIKSERREAFEVLIFGDTQETTSEQVGFLRDDVVSELVGSDAAFAMVLGDVLGDRLHLYDEHNAVMAEIGVPIFNVPGNHDMNFDSKDDAYAMETFIRHFGPPYYSFNYGDVHFVVLDDVEWHGKKKDKKGFYKGALSEVELEWLAADLKRVSKDKLIVLAMHIPVMIWRHGKNEIFLKNYDKLAELLKDYPNVLFLSAHTHTLEHHYLDEKKGWKAEKPAHHMVCGAACGGWWSGPKDVHGIPVSFMSDGTPNGYFHFYFDGNEYSERYKVARRDDDYQMRLISPAGDYEADELKGEKILVNVFNGGPRSKVTCRLNEGEPFGLERTIMKDPFVVDMFEKYEDEKVSWLNARYSTHVFAAPLPEDLAPGVHVLKVEHEDQYGVKSVGHQLFRVK